MVATKRNRKKAVIGRRPKSQCADLDSRGAILKAARTVFARSGFDGASTREVADIACVNNAMIYYHFKDKVELYRAVLVNSFSVLDRIWEHEIFRGNAPVREKIEKYIEEFIRFQHSNDDLRRICSMELVSCGENCRWLGKHLYSKSYEKLAAILKAGMKSGELKKVNPTFAIATLVGMIIHSFILVPVAEHVTGKRLDLSVTRFGAFVSELFFDGLGLGQARKRHGSKQGA
jgi:TetR/AcrR family transcriptional regulator